MPTISLWYERSPTHGEVLEWSGILNVGKGLAQALLLGGNLGDSLFGSGDL
jgi:hypothetical protein